ncbi:glycerate kinase [Carnobacterium sp. CS13]|uniref:glycerate kinase n=1 Tax=Carnobacterium sp. CS13 TaxID=2800128 RepID=UPI001911AD53|nr:glycerate kinase [Carnobacterium sp. CS13]QQP70572.1 glycerate kinase [Carnobacterium sp. CS13]
MKIVIAPDSFKESLTALEAANAIEEGFKKVFPDAEYVKIPMADGGEGTVQFLVDATKGRLETLIVQGPLGEPVEGFYGISGDGTVAIIEMAAASGLHLVPPSERNPLITSTWGTGELIQDALNKGVKEILIGIGGSATNDGGAGMIQCLGGELLDKKGQQIIPSGIGLADLVSIDLAKLNPKLKEVEIKVACDVDNPLTGPKGASYVYGFQKGGTLEQVEQLDQNLAHFARLIRQDLNQDIEFVAGAGAAGGLGGALLAFLGGKLQNGGELVSGLVGLADEVRNADLVITGEGGVNHQTIYGKTPICVAKIAQRYQVPVIAIAGRLSGDYEAIYEHGVTAVFSILSEITSLESALETGYENIKQTAQNIAAVIKIGK